MVCILFKKTGFVRVNTMLVLMLFSLCNLSSFSQVFFSTNNQYLKSKTEQNNLVTLFTANYPDSSINELSQFAPRNFMGNTGLPSPSYLLNYGTADLGFKLYPAPSGIDQISARQVEYYRSKGPFAQLTGIAGDKQLQIFRLFYTQSVKDRFNITLKFNRYTSLGYYNKQQTYTNNFYTSSNYTAKNKRWGYYFYILNNNNKNQENGGISRVVLNDSTVDLNKNLLSVNLSSASRDIRENQVMLNPWIRLNKRVDTAGGLNHYLQIKSRYYINANKYKDASSTKDTYYLNHYFDSLKTNDSTHIRQLINEAHYTIKRSNNRLNLSAGYKNEINKVWQKKDSVFVNHLFLADVYYSSKKYNASDSISNRSVETRLNAQYLFSGPNQGNYKVESNSALWLNESKRRYVYLDVLAEQRSPDYIYNYWNSNHFQWFNNGYKPQLSVEGRLGFKAGNLIGLSVFYQNRFRYLYFDAFALPRQYDKTIENIGVSLQLSKVLFKHLGVYVNHVFQSTNKAAYIRIPQNISTARLFYTGNLFHNNLQLQLGSQVQVYQAFSALNYMPSTQAYYLQDRYSTAACPFVDVYLNARIKPVSFFLKVENALQGLVGNNYSFVPGYYQTDRAFRCGITWVFFD